MFKPIRFRFGTLPILATGIATLLAGPITAHSAQTSTAITFLGAAAGDASSNDVILWTRTGDTSTPPNAVSVAVTLNISTDPTLQTGVTPITGTSVYNPASVEHGDGTLKLDVSSLQPATRYYYQFVGPNGEQSVIGTFKTLPAPTAAAPVHFAFSGDCDGLMRPYVSLDTIAQQNLDFYVFLGDTIYETASGGAVNNSPAVTATTSANLNQLYNQFSTKYDQQYLPVNASGQNCLQPFFAAQATYTVLDNHELGNKQYINGGAPAGTAVPNAANPNPGMSSGEGVDATNTANDVTAATGPFMNQAAGFQTLVEAYFDHQPVRNRGTVNAPADARSNGTVVQYYSEQVGRNAIFLNLDDRTYRDIRMKTSGGSDDTGSRGDNPNRTVLGATQLAWLENTLLQAENAGTPWKFIAISSPMDQIGPIGSAFTGIYNAGGSSYAPLASDGGKSWIGEYRAERNTLLKFIADHNIRNVVFLTTDDHQVRINEMTYSPTGQTAVQSSYVKVPNCFHIVAGPMGATGPDGITNHAYSNLKAMADSLAQAQTNAGIDPIGLDPNYPGLHNVVRSGDPSADSARQPIDFYSPDTFNYATLDVSADGKTLTVGIQGVNSTAPNAFTEYNSGTNPVSQILSFQVDAAHDPIQNIQNIVVIYQENWSFDALYGSLPGVNGIANASAASLNQLDRLTGNALSSETGIGTYVDPSTALVKNNPPSPYTGTYVSGAHLDPSFLNPDGSTAFNTLLPYLLTNVASNSTGLAPGTGYTTTQPFYDNTGIIDPTYVTGDIVHRYWTEQLQINGGLNNMFISWADDPGLVMSRFDATNLPEGLLAQQYTICDNFFHSAFGGSYLNHQLLVAAQPAVWVGPNGETPPAASIAALESNGALSQYGYGSYTGNVPQGKYAGQLVNDGKVTPIGGQSITFPGQTYDKNYITNTSFSINLVPYGINPTYVNSTSVGPSHNDSNPTGANGDKRPYYQNIGDSLSRANVSWKWYSGGWDFMKQYSQSNPSVAFPDDLNVTSAFNVVNRQYQLQWHHQALAYFDNYAPFGTGIVDPSLSGGTTGVTQAQNSAAHLQDESQLFADIQNGTLPAVSFVKPVGINNEHPGYSALQVGQNHVASIVQALQANPTLWAHTAVIVTYDEHGGRWDHATPPTRDVWGPGLRVPALIISPYAKQGSVDHTLYDTTSVLSTIEHRFGVAPLNGLDAAAPTFANSFTNTQVVLGGLKYNRRTHQYLQPVTVTNGDTVPLNGPIYLAFDNLTANATIAGPGTVGTAANGSPYITLQTGALAANGSVVANVTFNNPSNAAISYSARVVTGGPTP